MKTKHILTSLGVAAMALMTACSQNDGLTRTENPNALKFTYSIDGIGTENKTRATVEASAEEQTINEMYLFFFDANVDRNGQFVECVTISGPLDMSSTYPVSGNDITSADEYNVIAIANIDNYIGSSPFDWSASWTGYTERQFAEDVIANIAFTSNGIEPDWIPMYGYTTKPHGSGNLDITMTRVVARIDVQNNVSTHNFESVSVWNAYYQSSLTGDRVMDYSKVLGSRTQKFYNGIVDQTEQLCQNQLYVFENQVISPENGDRYTTCVIVGLEGGSGIRYYRINIHPNGSAQNLKRNNAYKITITGVNGDGYDSEEEAYTGTTTELDYHINYWDLDDNGLIVSDMYSILALPTKTVRIGQEAVNNSYTITTFSTLPNPAPLTIKSQIYDPSDGKIVARLSGNTLYIDAAALPDGDPDRSGIITVTFADLEASINVYQSSSVDKYLTITLEDGWDNILAPTAHVSSENIYVSASGPWTATLYDNNLDPAFSLNTSNTIEKELRSVDYPNLTRFRIYTVSQNNTLDLKQGFVLISLDDDPVNHVAVVPISQKPASQLNVVPDINRLTFDGSMRVSYPSTNVITFTSTGTLQAPSFTGDDVNEFTMTHTLSGNSGTVTITPKDVNDSGRTYSAILKVEDNSGGSATIAVTQTSLDLLLSPSTINSAVSAKGGYTKWISVTGAVAPSTYSVDATTYGNVYNHEAYIETENGQSGPTVTGVPIGQRFRIVFPMVYYPNRDQEISATAKVTLDGSTLEASISAKQTPLTSQGLKIWSQRGWGAFNSGVYAFHNNYFLSYSKTLDPNMPNVTYASGTTTNNTCPSPTSYTYMNLVNEYMTSTHDWTHVRTFMDRVDGLAIFMCDSHLSNQLSNINNSPMKDYGYSFAPRNTGSGRTNVVNTNAAGTRIYEFFVNRGRNTISGTIEGFYKDGYATYAVTKSPTGVQIMSYVGGEALMVVDPANGFIFHGDCTVFIDNAQMNTNNKINFMYNYVDYVCLSAMYGSHFMDMFIDDPTHPRYVEAPWDSVWGPHAWDGTNIK